MENNVNPNQGTNNPTKEQLLNKVKTASTESVKAKVIENVASPTNPISIHVAIRRKPSLVGLPGSDPAERVYKIGSSLDMKTKGNLKGVSEELESKFMPEVVGISPNAPEFKRAVDDYWSSISVLVPVDEVHLKDYEKGLVLKVSATTKTSVAFEKFNLAKTIEDKMKVLNEGLVNNSITLKTDCINDFLLLNYCLKYSVVANNIEDVHKSPKILFYIYSKESAVKSAQNLLELKAKAVKLFESLENDDKKIDAVLLTFDVNPTEFETTMDKYIEIDKLYSKNKETYIKFIDFVEDSRWEDKYLITRAAKLQKLNNPINTTVYYYNQVLIGRTLDEAVLTLNDGSSEMSQIKMTLKRELNIQ